MEILHKEIAELKQKLNQREDDLEKVYKDFNKYKEEVAKNNTLLDLMLELSDGYKMSFEAGGILFNHCRITLIDTKGKEVRSIQQALPLDHHLQIDRIQHLVKYCKKSLEEKRVEEASKAETKTNKGIKKHKWSSVGNGESICVNCQLTKRVYIPPIKGDGNFPVTTYFVDWKWVKKRPECI
jgi:hypothetical protein